MPAKRHATDQTDPSRAPLPEPPPGCKTIPSYRAQQRYGVDRYSLVAAVADGKVRAFSVAGRQQFAVEDLEEVFAGGGDDETETDWDYRAESLNSVSNLTKELTAMIREVRQQNAELHKLVVDPMQAGLKLLQSFAEKQTDRIAALEKGWFDMFATKEQMLSEQADRELQVRQYEDTQRRKAEMFEWLKGLAPDALAAWAKQSDLKRFAQAIPMKVRRDLYDLLDPETRRVAESIAPSSDATMQGEVVQEGKE